MSQAQGDPAEIPVEPTPASRGAVDNQVPAIESAPEGQTAEAAVIYVRPPGPVGPVGILVGNVPRGPHECLLANDAPADQDAVLLSALAPMDHPGLTAQAHPFLYWFLSLPSQCQAVLTLIDDKRIEPLLESTIPAPIAPGVHQLSLNEHNVRLEVGGRYMWSVALVPDPDDRSKDLIASATMERVVPPDSIKRHLEERAADAPRVYAEAGYWYDALAAITQSIRANPRELLLSRQRASLLQQVGLRNVAAHLKEGDATSVR